MAAGKWIRELVQTLNWEGKLILIKHTTESHKINAVPRRFVLYATIAVAACLSVVFLDL